MKALAQIKLLILLVLVPQFASVNSSEAINLNINGQSFPGKIKAKGIKVVKF